ncbi:MAG: RdgB/HAM1 family non-canonical purine NTP pyrophosphatase [Actinobacteria bacterium]|nr:RdgB/HAM1 family non-canonical purine NTP pyrophosphatase [Actinomycetota bacterium]
MVPPEIVIASSNKAKIAEIVEIFSELDVTLLTKSDLSVWPDDMEESGVTYLDNALIKARAVCRVTGKPALADDSGIEVDALDGAPGVHSARFAGANATEEENNQKLEGLLSSTPKEKRGARYRCVAVVVFPEGDEIAAHGTCEGTIAESPKGEGGFGYDPWFIPFGGSRRMAELSTEEKHAISHRGKALRALAEKLDQRLKA